MPVLLVGVSTRALTESAVGAGFSCYTMDLFGDYDQGLLASGRTGGGLVTLCREALKIPPSPLVYTGLENLPDWVDRLAKRHVLWGNPGEALAVRRWSSLEPVLDRFQNPHPLVRYGVGPETDEGRRWLLKRKASGGGIGITWWKKGTAFSRAFYLQEFIEGTAGSAVFVADGEKALLLALTEQMAGDPASPFPFCYAGSIVPAAYDATGRVAGQAMRMAGILTRVFGLKGLNTIDFIVRGNTAYFLEVNPRYSSSMELVEKLLRMNLFNLHVQACTGMLQDCFKPGARGAFWGKRIVYARRDLRLGDTRGWLNLGLRDIPRPFSAVRRGMPLCTVLAGGSDREECLRNLEATAVLLEGQM